MTDRQTVTVAEMAGTFRPATDNPDWDGIFVYDTPAWSRRRRASDRAFRGPSPRPPTPAPAPLGGVTDAGDDAAAELATLSGMMHLLQDRMDALLTRVGL